MSKGIPVERCGNCRYWLALMDHGVCRRYPPKMEPIDSIAPHGHRDKPVLPRVYVHDWCGEWVGGAPEGGQG